ncbi:hypothetical protein [Halopseudomonas pelagia]|uniref:hypothetical protein n=1 Tax=Halopseudomonas pelagia TaxID=553151 RepID=UPI0030DC562C|tara:strand:- start:1874 stop:2575 length:702 start_codon:yes stop_codon:yes gene_type:complete
MIKTIRNLLYRPPQLPISNEDIGDYQIDFVNAIRFTQSCGFSVARPSWKPHEKLEVEGTFLEPALRAAGVKDVRKAAFQCLKWCHYLAPHLEQKLKRKVWVTIGQIWTNDRAMFSPTWNDLRNWSKRGITVDEMHKRGSSGLNLHAWLTVDSGEIIEPTLMTSIATLFPDKYPHFLGAVSWGQPADILSEYKYFPMAVGAEFAECLHSKSQIGLLARSSQELHSMSMALVFRS